MCFTKKGLLVKVLLMYMIKSNINTGSDLKSHCQRAKTTVGGSENEVLASA